jgi:iron(III)-enterobactin esterase
VRRAGAVAAALLVGCGGGHPALSPAPARYSIMHVDSFPSLLLNERRVLDVYLPPGYDSAGKARYQVLYLNDGQDAAALGLLVTLDTLTAHRRIPPIVVIAIHANDQRMQDYGTAGTPNAQGFGARARLYERFVLEEVMPWANARFHLEPGPAHTAVLGSSLGGLGAFDLAWRHPDVFGTAGAMSGSFWWRAADGTLEEKQASRIAIRMARETTPLPRLRAWFETASGDETSDRDGNGVIDSIQDTDDLVDALVARGYRRGKDVVHVTVEGRHDQETWERVLPIFLEFAFK